MKNAFISSQKLFSFLRNLNYCPEFFCDVEKRIGQKVKVNFKTYDLINWERIIYSTISNRVKEMMQ